LIHQYDPVTLGIKKPAVIVFAPATRASVNNEHRHTIRIAALFYIQFVRRIYREAMLGIRLDVRKQGEHKTLQKRDLTGV
jgi:hypothetical protein